MFEEITTLISSVGFPIVACAVMFKQNDKLTTSLTELTTTLKGIDTRIDQLEKGVQ